MNHKNDRSQYEKMTQTPVSHLVMRLSVPTIISMMVTNVYNLADTAFVGQLGNSASGAVGVVFGFMAILQAIGFMFGQGSGNLISRKLGQQDTEAATRIASTGFFFSIFSGVILAAFCMIFLDPLVYALGSTATIAPYAKTYIHYILLAAPFMVASFTMNNILRYEGLASLGMIGLMAGGILNICGDPFFMFVLDFGIAGAGISTALSQIISFLILLSMFLRHKTQCRLRISKVSLKPSLFADIALTGLPSLLRQGLNSLATVILNLQAAAYGDEAVAAMSIVARIVFFVFSIAIGTGQGFQPVSGFNYGAGKFSRVRKAFKFTLIYSELLVLVLTIFVLLNARSLVHLFRDDITVSTIAVRALYLQCLAQLVMPVCMVTEMFLQSTGHKLTSSLLSSMRSGFFFIPLVIILAHLRGLAGIQEAQPIAFLLTCIPALIFLNAALKEMPQENTLNGQFQKGGSNEKKTGS